MDQVIIKIPKRNIEVSIEDVPNFRKLLSFVEDLEDKKTLEYAIANDKSKTISFNDYDRTRGNEAV